MNKKLQANILEVVDNQLKENNPPCTKEVFDKLRALGYSKSVAKEKIGGVVVTEIYNLVKENRPFDEEKYRESLEEMLEIATVAANDDDDDEAPSEWDEFEQLVCDGDDCFEENRHEEGLLLWDKAWEVFQAIIETYPQKKSISQLMEDYDGLCILEDWFFEYSQELFYVAKFEERIQFFKKILEILDWTEDDDDFYRRSIGDYLLDVEKTDEALAFYEAWLKDAPDNLERVLAYSDALAETGDEKKAYEVIRKATWGLSCDLKNSLLFTRAIRLAADAGKPEESKWYQEQIDQYESYRRELRRELRGQEDEDSDFYQTPYVKSEDIRPNEPCPCGSGKKYKKCCGKK